jgi:hypothetical protein
MRRSGQCRTGQEQEASALHPTTTAQHDDGFDGTPVVPGGDEHWIVLGIIGVLEIVSVLVLSV